MSTYMFFHCYDLEKKNRNNKLEFIFYSLYECFLVLLYILVYYNFTFLICIVFYF